MIPGLLGMISTVDSETVQEYAAINPQSLESTKFCCLSYNIPLRLSDSILLRLLANSDCSSTETKNLL